MNPSKVRYLNNLGYPCIRHGKVVKENGSITFLPHDTTKKIIISRDNYIGCDEVKLIIDCAFKTFNPKLLWYLPHELKILPKIYWGKHIEIR